MVILLIIAGILFELIILVGGVYLCLKLFKKQPASDDRKIEVKVSGKNITSEVVRDGVKDAIREIAYEDEQEKILEKKRKTPEQVYSSISQEEPPIQSGGELIPFDITDGERELLRQFYSKSD